VVQISVSEPRVVGCPGRLGPTRNFRESVTPAVKFFDSGPPSRVRKIKNRKPGQRVQICIAKLGGGYVDPGGGLIFLEKMPEHGVNTRTKVRFKDVNL